MVQLFIFGFHELTEANVLPYSEPLHWATSRTGLTAVRPYLSYLLVLLPVAWLFSFRCSAETRRRPITPRRTRTPPSPRRSRQRLRVI